MLLIARLRNHDECNPRIPRLAEKLEEEDAGQQSIRSHRRADGELSTGAQVLRIHDL